MKQEIPIVIELVGIPGAGKTTLRRSVQRVLEDRGINFGGLDTLNPAGTSVKQRSLLHRFVSKAERCLDFDLLLWNLHTQRYGQSVSRPDRSRTESINQYLTSVLAMRDAVYGKTRYDLWLFDEGVSQRLLGLGVSDGKHNVRALRAALKYAHAILPFRVVYVDTPSDLAWERARIRHEKTGRKNVWCTSKGREMLPAFAATLRHIASILDDSGLLLTRIDAATDLGLSEGIQVANLIEREMTMPSVELTQSATA